MAGSVRDRAVRLHLETCARTDLLGSTLLPPGLDQSLGGPDAEVSLPLGPPAALSFSHACMSLGLCRPHPHAAQAPSPLPCPTSPTVFPTADLTPKTRPQLGSPPTGSRVWTLTPRSTLPKHSIRLLRHSGQTHGRAGVLALQGAEGHGLCLPGRPCCNRDLPKAQLPSSHGGRLQSEEALAVPQRSQLPLCPLPRES